MCVIVGFLEKEIVKDGIELLDTGENPEAPASREMSDLEVSQLVSTVIFLPRVSHENMRVYFS